MTQRLTDDEVRKVARLGRLELSEEEVHHFAGQLSKVLDYVSKLSELEVDDVEPMVHAMETSNVLREDVEKPGMPVAEALRNAPAPEPPFIQVPKVIDDGSAA
ncbi:MAG: Asp-tRNA(Asn)/Glu-tRNA(Gln) amidotransferase subunit GatC [Phycisphaeraceae bacterium]